MLLENYLEKKEEIKEVHIIFDSNCQGFFSYFLYHYYKNAKKFFLKDVDYKIYDLAFIFDQPKHTFKLESNKTINDKHDLLTIELNKYNADKVKLFLWYNSENANSILNYMFFAQFFSHFKNVYLVKFNKYKQSSSDIYRLTNSLNNKKRLKANDYKKLFKEYKDLKKEEGFFLVKNEKITCYPEDFFDNIVLSLLSDKYKKGSKLIEEFVTITNERYGYVDFCLFRVIIDKLCKKDLVEPSEPYDVLFIPNRLKFKIKKPRKTKIKYLEALNILAYALENGSTYELYRILTDDAVFYSVSTQTKIEGREEIIAYIEQKALRRIETNSETKTNFFMPKGINSNYLEDIKICLYYPPEQGLDEVKFEFNNGKISKILVNPTKYSITDLKRIFYPFELKLKQKNRNSFKNLDIEKYYIDDLNFTTTCFKSHEELEKFSLSKLNAYARVVGGYIVNFKNKEEAINYILDIIND